VEPEERPKKEDSASDAVNKEQTDFETQPTVNNVQDEEYISTLHICETKKPDEEDSAEEEEERPLTPQSQFAKAVDNLVSVLTFLVFGMFIACKQLFQGSTQIYLCMELSV